MISKILKINVVLLINLILLIGIVSAFGAFSGYNTLDAKLKLYPGEEKTIDFGIYPTPEEGNLQLKVSVSEGKDIAKIIGEDIYAVSAMQHGKVNVKITIPVNSKIGDEYPISLVFQDQSTNNQGTVGFVTQVTSSFKVVVVEKPVNAETPSNINSTWLIVGIIAILVVIAAIWFAMKKK